MRIKRHMPPGVSHPANRACCRSRSDFFEISCNENGTRWTGKAWFVYKLLKYEFDLQFEVRSS